jgi:hypothetical protein
VNADSDKGAIGGVKKIHLDELERERMILEEQQKIDRLKNGQGAQQ